MTGTGAPAVSGLQMLVGLGIGMVTLVLLVLRTRVPAVLVTALSFVVPG